MIRWLGVVSGALAVVAVWALPPSVLPTPTRRSLPEQVREETLSREAGRLNAALRARRWADSLTNLAVREAVDGVALGPPHEEGLDPEVVRQWSERERERFRRLDPRDPDLVVGLYWQPYRLGARPGLPIAASWRDMTFVGEREGRGLCVRATPYIPPSLPQSLSYPMDPGACILYAKYGMPGAGIQAWMEASSMGFARVSEPGFSHDVAAALLPSEPPPRIFGLTRPFFADESLIVQACLAGHTDACERAVADPVLVTPEPGDDAWLLANTPVSGLGGGAASAPFGYLDDALLFEVEADFGPEAFARFWSSSAPVPQAFESAFGEPLGDWVLRWAEGHVGLYRSSPAVPWGAAGWSALAFALLGVVVTGTARRRRVC